MAGLPLTRFAPRAMIFGAGFVLLSVVSVNAVQPLPSSTNALVQIQWQPPPYSGYELLTAPPDPVIVRNGADAAVTAGATQPTIFDLTGTYLVSQIMTYHYGAQKMPGTIALEHEDGTIYGPWQAAGAVGTGNLPNSYWWARPDVVLKPGRYMVIDSDPSTWSTEPVTEGAGIILVWGRPL